MTTRVEGIDAPEREYGRRGRRRPGRRVRAVIATVVAVGAVIAAVGAGSAWYLLVRPDVAGVAPGQPVSVEIEQGASTAAIAAQLSGAGVVPNANRFRLEARRLGADNQLRAGVYDLETGMTYEEVISLLANGPLITYVTVTIPEGWTIPEVAERVERDTGIAAEEFEALAESGFAEFPRAYLRDVEGSLQGYLFPKTYRVEEGMTAREVINMMLDQFETELAEVDVAAAEARGLSLHELVTLASLIERETRVAQERPLVSSVIHNRLEKGMRLQIDATIEYVLPGTRVRLSYEDLQIDSPYNTYRYAGLPPGPIANPGLASLKAAAAPADTDYIYYVLTGLDGSHTFTVTYEEFLRAKERSREVLGE
ncbi:MAG TPA: endolytic transglycosylase MltG [Coriobacteriia bacterium]|nr:endolytic transglycosylase MltG [Coriobacteriia bacterium]